LNGAAGALWRSRFDAERNLIVVNSGHRDFVFATRSRTLQLRHLVRLYVKELVLKKLFYRGLSAERLMERLIELSLYVEEKLKAARRVVTDSSAAGSGRQRLISNNLSVCNAARRIRLTCPAATRTEHLQMLADTFLCY
jgi:hypothetical protein